MPRERQRGDRGKLRPCEYVESYDVTCVHCKAVVARLRKPAGNRCSNDERTDAGFPRPSNNVIGALLGELDLVGR